EGRCEVHGRLSLVPQLFESPFDYTAFDMVLMGRVRHVGLFSEPSPRDEEMAWSALDRLGIAHLADRTFQQLSGGERQLVIFARALVAEPQVLVLDEPTSSLDLGNQRLILEWIARLAAEDGLTVLLTTHHPHHALAVADDVLLMLGSSEYV